MAFSIGGTNQSTIFKDKVTKTWNLSNQYHSLTNKEVNASGTHTGNFWTLRDITNHEPDKALEFMQMNQELANRELNCLKWEMSHLKNQLSDVNISRGAIDMNQSVIQHHQMRQLSEHNLLL